MHKLILQALYEVVNQHQWFTARCWDFTSRSLYWKETFLSTEISSVVKKKSDWNTFCRRRKRLTDLLPVAQKWSMRVMDDWTVWLGLIAEATAGFVDYDRLISHGDLLNKHLIMLSPTVASELSFLNWVETKLSAPEICLFHLSANQWAPFPVKVVYIIANSGALAERHISHLNLLQGRHCYTLLTIESLWVISPRKCSQHILTLEAE